MNALRKNIFLVGLVNFLTEFKLYGAFAALYFTAVTGSMTLGMSIFSAAMLSATLLELPTGILSDAVGRKKTILLGAFSALVSVILYAIGQNIFTLLSGAFFEGLSAAFFSGNNDAYLFDILKEKRLEKNFNTFLGKTRSMTHLALCLAAAAGGVLLYFGSYALILWLSVIPKALCLVAAFCLYEPRATSNKEKINPFRHIGEILMMLMKNKRLLKIVVADSLSAGAGEAAYQFRVTFLNRVWPLWAIGFAGTLGDAGAALSYWISGKWIKKKGHGGVILIGKLYGLVINIASFLMKNAWSPVLMTTTSLFYGVTSVAQEDLAQQLYSDKHRATMGSFKSLAGSLLFSVLAVLIGLLADSFGVVAALVSFQAFAVVSLLVYASLFKKGRRDDSPAIMEEMKT